MYALAPYAPRPTRWANWLAWIALCTSVLVVGPLAAGAVEIYARVDKPWWAPAAWSLLPIWIALAALAGTATYLMCNQTDGVVRQRVLSVFGALLGLHLVWVICFSTGHFGLALVVGLAAWIIAGCVASLYGLIIPLAGGLMVPTWLWITFATAIDAAIWWLAR